MKNLIIIVLTMFLMIGCNNNLVKPDQETETKLEQEIINTVVETENLIAIDTAFYKLENDTIFSLTIFKDSNDFKSIYLNILNSDNIINFKKINTNNNIDTSFTNIKSIDTTTIFKDSLLLENIDFEINKLKDNDSNIVEFNENPEEGIIKLRSTNDYTNFIFKIEFEESIAQFNPQQNLGTDNSEENIDHTRKDYEQAIDGLRYYIKSIIIVLNDKKLYIYYI